MCSHVHTQATGLRERLAASGTDERFFPCMCTHVRFQVVGRRERFPTGFTDVRSLI